MPKFMLLIQGAPNAFDGLSPEEIQDTVQRYRSWLESLQTSGRYVVSDKLQDEGGRVVSRQNGRVSVVDGPFSEAKEVVGGYITIRAGSYDEAVAIVSDCPFIDHGSVAIRQTDPMGCGEE